MATEKIIDGNATFLGGQDASKSPDKVGKGNYFAGINVTTENGSLKPRWGWKRRELTFPKGGIERSNLTINSYENIFRSGRFQALARYSIGSEYFQVAIISGVIFLINQDSGEVNIIEISDGSRISEGHKRVNWSPAGRYLVIYDWPAYPVIVDGLEARRADPAKNEIPISVLGTYNQDRLFIGNAGNEFTGGDAVGNTATPDAPVSFNEVLQPASTYFGQIFQLSTNYNNDEITAMTFLQSIDLSTGIGPLLIATEKAIYSYQTQSARAAWQAGQFGSLFNFENGIAGPQSLVGVNSDLFFMSPDGQIRTASMSRQEQGRWSRVPLSREVKNWLKYWDKSLVKYSDMGYFKNKILATCNPYKVEAQTINGLPITDVAFGGFVVLETDNIANISSQAPPAWAGLWTGVRPMAITVNNDRLFIMSKDERVNHLYEATPENTIDILGTNERYIRSRVYTREYDFDAPMAQKSLREFTATLENIQGDFEIDIKYKPGHGSSFIDFNSFKHCAPWRTFSVPTDEEINGFSGHEFRDFLLGPRSSNECNPVSKDKYNVFKKVQLMVTITGKYWELDSLTIASNVSPSNMTKAVCTNEYKDLVVVPKQCSDDWAYEGINICQTTQT